MREVLVEIHDVHTADASVLIEIIKTERVNDVSVIFTTAESLHYVIEPQNVDGLFFWETRRLEEKSEEAVGNFLYRTPKSDLESPRHRVLIDVKPEYVVLGVGRDDSELVEATEYVEEVVESEVLEVALKFLCVFFGHENHHLRRDSFFLLVLILFLFLVVLRFLLGIWRLLNHNLPIILAVRHVCGNSVGFFNNVRGLVGQHLV